MPAEPIRVLLVDDQALLVAAFHLLIDSCDDMRVVGTATNGFEAVEAARTTRPDITVMDIRMPALDGLAATEQICADPDLSATKVLILTTFETEEHVARALHAGASGFLGKDASSDELLTAIRTVAAGDALLSPVATRALIRHYLARPSVSATTPRSLDSLTDREREVMAKVAEGLSNDEIAGMLYLSPLTVRTHVHRAMAKLQARDRAQLVVIAYQSGLMKESTGQRGDAAPTPGREPPDAAGRR